MKGVWTKMFNRRYKVVINIQGRYWSTLPQNVIYGVFTLKSNAKRAAKRLQKDLDDILTADTKYVAKVMVKATTKYDHHKIYSVPSKPFIEDDYRQFLEALKKAVA